MEIISEQSAAAKQVSEQFKHGEQEIKEGVGRHCTSQSLTPLPGEGMWESQQRLGPGTDLAPSCATCRAPTPERGTEAGYEHIMVMMILCTSKASSLTQARINA